MSLNVNSLGKTLVYLLWRRCDWKSLVFCENRYIEDGLHQICLLFEKAYKITTRRSWNVWFVLHRALC